jgi:hypothetical protein
LEGLEVFEVLEALEIFEGFEGGRGLDLSVFSRGALAGGDGGTSIGAEDDEIAEELLELLELEAEGDEGEGAVLGSGRGGD